jgi:hypothetical protein
MELHQEAAFCTSRSGFCIFDDVASFPHHRDGSQGQEVAIGAGLCLLHGEGYDIIVNVKHRYTNSWFWLESPL